MTTLGDEPVEDENSISNNPELEKVTQQVLIARVIIFIIAGISLIEIPVEFYLFRDLRVPMEELGGFPGIRLTDIIFKIAMPLLLCILFLMLGINFRKNPHNSVLSGLIIYCIATGINLVIAIMDFSNPSGTSLNYGWVIKIFIIAGLVNALKTARRHKVIKSKIVNTNDVLDAEWMKNQDQL